MAVVLVPLLLLLLGATVVEASGAVPPVMWIVLVLRVMGVGDMLRLRRFTLTGRLVVLLVVVVVVQLVVLEGAAVSLAALLAALSDDDDEMAILVERADIDLVMTLVVVVLELLLLECSTLLLVNVECC